MKKRIGIVCILCMLILTTFHVSMAAENTITLNLSKQKVKVGDEFTVTIKQTYGENCESIEGNLEYDSAFELVKLDLKEWNNLSGSNTKIEAIPASGAPESVLVYTFKAKSNITDGKISFKNIKVSVIQNGTPVAYDVADQTVAVTVGDETKPDDNPSQTKTLAGVQITKKPSTTTYTEGAIFDPAGMEIVAVYSDGTSKVITNYTYAPSEALKVGDKEVTFTYTESGVTRTVTEPITVNPIVPVQNNNNNNSNNNSNNNNAQNSNTQTQAKDTTTTNANTLPKTGTTMLLTLSVLGMIAVGLVFYKRYQKYKDI